MQRRTAAGKLLGSHLVDGVLAPGGEIGLRIDQTLTQDATGTLVMLELEAMGLDRVQTEISAQYVDHNILQVDAKNADDHLFLQSACARFGVWYSRPGKGVSHPVHMQRFGQPGKSLLGSDSHTCAAGSIGMLAIGAGGLDVAMAMAGEPFYVKMPSIWGIELTGALPQWVSAKDVILELLRRHGVDGATGRILEYFGPGLASLSAMDRHVIANMGAELGATTSVFPSDEETHRFLKSEGRARDWRPLQADPGSTYDHHDAIALDRLQPLIARPSSPGHVVPVASVAGEPVSQAYLGSSANPGYRDFAIAAAMVDGRSVHPAVSFDVNPSSRQLLAMLIRDGWLGKLVAAGARLHQAGCNGCIGMGQAPATGRNSLRTVPRNFPGRSGTHEDSVWLCSPETATAAALTGVITDPRTLGLTYPQIEPPRRLVRTDLLQVPPAVTDDRTELVLGPNIAPLPEFGPLPDQLEVPVALALGDDVSTDEILPAGARVLPWRSNIPRIAEFAFGALDPSYPARAEALREESGHGIVAGSNYGQGSSREHAALAPRYLGLRLVLARSFARIHWQNLINFGVLPLTFVDSRDRDRLRVGDVLRVDRLGEVLSLGNRVEVRIGDRSIETRHELSSRQVDVLLAGGLVGWMRDRIDRRGAPAESSSGAAAEQPVDA